MQFLSRAKFGDVYTAGPYHPYTDSFFRGEQQFRNTPPILPKVITSTENPAIFNGRNVIEIGFVDFGMSIEIIDCISTEGPPVVIHAFDESALCIAKSLVMIEMMKIPSTEKQSVVEVWVCTLWSLKTLKAFKTALHRLLHGIENESARNDMIPRVKAILQLWYRAATSKTQISKYEAIVFWREHHIKYWGTFYMHAVNLSDPGDRVDALRYEMIGSIYEDPSIEVVGSITMCLEEPSLSIKQPCESCLEIAPTSIHMGSRCSDIPFIIRYHRYFETRIETYMKHIRSGSLIFKPSVASIGVRNESVLVGMEALDPCMVGWSNVIDYIKPSDFHIMARRISSKTSPTVHYAHSCNWINAVYGTDVIEIQEDKKAAVYEAGYEIYRQSRTHRLHGFCSTPFAHGRNICQPVLLLKCINPFLRFFFGNQSDVSFGSVDGKNPMSEVINPFLRANSAVHFVFSYGPLNYNFGADSYDFMSDPIDDSTMTFY